MSSAAGPIGSDVPDLVRYDIYRRRPVRMTLRTRQGATGAAMVALVVLVILVGPYVAPHSSGDFAGKPFESPSSTALLGTDYQGHDVLSVVLNGGGRILSIAGGGALISIMLAGAFGLLAGGLPGRTSRNALRVLDVALVFPPIVLGLLVLTRGGTSAWLLLLVTVATQFPPSARVFWAATTAIRGEDYIESAQSIGLSRRKLLWTEFAPNLVAPVLAEIPVRLTYCIAIVTTLAFLGFGAEPPAIDWGTMINQNKGALTLQPWPVLAPVGCIAAITIGANLFADALRGQLTSLTSRNKGAR